MDRLEKIGMGSSKEKGLPVLERESSELQQAAAQVLPVK
jgi:hypothetical protein